MRRTLIFLGIILFTFSGCEKEKINSGSSYFVLTEIKNPGLKSTQAINKDETRTTFELGDLKASKEFYFLLTNGGETPVFDIQLSTDNTHFVVTPEEISQLNTEDSENNEMIPLISLGILHGTQLNGVGLTDLLPMGENTATLTITGKTLIDGDTVDLESSFNISIDAKVMDISIYCNDEEIDLLNPTGVGVFGSYGGLGTIRYYYSPNDTITIENTGNVAVDIQGTVMDNFGTKTLMDIISLSPDQSQEVALTDIFVIFALDSDGTITDDARIQLGLDGKGYLVLSLNKP